MYRDHRKGHGGPPDGATYPGGPHGLKWREKQPLMGWCAPSKGPRRLGLETLGGRCPEGACAPWLETLRGGGTSTWLGSQATPRAAAPFPRWDLQGAGAPLGPYI